MKYTVEITDTCVVKLTVDADSQRDAESTALCYYYEDSLKTVNRDIRIKTDRENTEVGND